MVLIVNLVLLGVGLYWCITAVTTMPLWQGISLAGGLLPAVASGVMVLLLIFELLDILKKNKINKEYFVNSFKEVNWQDMIPVAVGLGILVGIKLIGMLLTLTLMLFCWLKFLSGYSVKKSAVVTICVMLFLYGVFKLWLKLPLPQGLLGLI
ncbi:tripartite tricarboxylate transporter TctB family protein [uncultured Dysosmobacter sp.]|uniref:tripartite tricarboxylate transporter TctB family protein n=1 Tax=uncultured Dysosmobacter sp. TaxID=2591384 RepID=UPI00263A2DE5|nr:tripartite tricarboxylate transporter TctB family protein [uncultured Dysosmobacter sp.]